jgi:hypothetical protein
MVCSEVMREKKKAYATRGKSRPLRASRPESWNAGKHLENNAVGSYSMPHGLLFDTCRFWYWATSNQRLDCIMLISRKDKRPQRL